MKMRINYIILIIILSSIIILITGCNKNEEYFEYNLMNSLDSIENFTKDNNEEINFELKSYYTNKDPIGCLTNNQNSLFYTVETPLLQSNLIKNIEIYQKNLHDNEEKLLYIELNNYGFYINELTATENYLFWYKYLSGKTCIEKFNIKTKEITKVIEFDDSPGVIRLSTDGTFLTWCDYSSDNIRIFVYSIEKEDIYFLDEEFIYPSSPYQKLSIFEGKIAYYKSNKQDISQIVVYDLNNNKCIGRLNLNLPQDNVPTRICINNNYISYQIDVVPSQIDVIIEENHDLYAFNYKNNKLIQVNSTDDLYIFDYILIDDVFFINDRVSNQIILRKLSNNGEIIATKDLDSDSLYILSKSSNLHYFTYDAENHKIIQIDLK